jgi:four helix bundle protein
VNRESLHRESTPKRPGQVSTFEDLEVYRVAREFRRAMYRIARELPEIEKFGFASQIRRAAVSLTNNIAEGHGRYHFPDQIRFALQARASLEELLDHLNTCDDEQYVPSSDVHAFKDQGWRVRQLLDGYIRYLRQQTTSGASRVKDEEWGEEDAGDSRFSI